MNQSEATRLIPKLRYALKDRRRLRTPQGPQGRHDKIRKIVTALFKHERIELPYTKADESRGYAERLISDAIRFGDRHKPTMDMASYWIIEKQLVHKLFKVLAPRYQNSTLSYTKMWRAPTIYPLHSFGNCVLELRNNIYPPLGPDQSNNGNLIHNVLLKAAKGAYQKQKMATAEAALKKTGSGGEAKKEVTKGATENLVADSVASQSDEMKSSVKEDLGNKNNVDTKLDSKTPDESINMEGTQEKSNVEPQVEKDLNISELKISEMKGDEVPNKEKEK